MLMGRFALAISVLACLLSASGEKRLPASQMTQNERVRLLEEQVENLSERVRYLEKGNGFGRFQIAVTTYHNNTEDLSFAQVFRVDTQTGQVCQVVGSNVRKGELFGTTLPYCTQQ